MLKEAKFTLYDVFAYLLPGFVVVLAISVLYWATITPDEVGYIPPLGVEGWVAFLVLGYFGGHIGQALSNITLKIIEWHFITAKKLDTSKKWGWLQKGSWFAANDTIFLDKKSTNCLSDDVIKAAKQKLATISGLDTATLNCEMFARACDEAVVQRGNAGDREIFVYREGFYRGMWLALLLMTLAILARGLAGPATFIVPPQGERPITLGMLAFAFLLTLASCWLCFYRFRRFGRYRIVQSILAFLTMPEDKKKPEKKDHE